MDCRAGSCIPLVCLAEWTRSSMSIQYTPLAAALEVAMLAAASEEVVSLSMAR